MARTDRAGDTQQEALTQTQVLVDRVYPNPWNVNEMDQATYQKELASIREYGFIDPILVRSHPWEPDAWQIIDGEHRWLGAKELGYSRIPANIIDVDDETAQELSLVLNDLRGTANQVKLSALVRSLAEKRDPERLQRVLPYSRERFAEMIAATREEKVDFAALQKQRKDILGKRRDMSWVERVYRLPADSAKVVDDALGRIMEQEQITEDWRALELMAADSLAGQ
jgi:ParB/RepB/Spo0J family partition protein